MCPELRHQELDSAHSGVSEQGNLGSNQRPDLYLLRLPGGLHQCTGEGPTSAGGLALPLPSFLLTGEALRFEAHFWM